MRLETRPEGRWAVERVQVSGTGEGEVCRLGCENQAWNWVKGDRSRAERCRVECWNWAACAGWCEGSVSLVLVVVWDEAGASPGAKMSFSLALDMLGWVVL